MIEGDLSTMSLADILQWADMSFSFGRLTVEREGGSIWLKIAKRSVLMVSPPPDSSRALHELGSKSADIPWQIPRQDEAAERALDLFFETDGRFRFVEDEPAKGGVKVDLPLKHLVHEGMRHLDEWPGISEAYPDNSARLRMVGEASTAGLSRVGRIVLRAAAAELTIGEVMLGLGLSRSALLRRTHELFLLKLLTVEGASPGDDPVARLIAQSESLVREAQFDEAAHVIGALVATNPNDGRLRAWLDEIEQEHVDALYQELQSTARLRRTEVDADKVEGLVHADREVLMRIDGEGDVVSLVLTSPLRELETLKSMHKLIRLGLAELP